MEFKDKVSIYGGYGFTNDQERGLDLLNKWYNDPKDLLFTLSGRAGTGKTYMLKYFIDKIVKNPICVSAPTHKAVRQVERSTGRQGKTLQSILGLRPNVNLDTFDLHNVQFDQLGTPTISNYRIIVIDECSMINSDLLNLLIKKASDLGVKLLFVGDPCQLPPVNKHNENDASISPTFELKNNYELKEIIRQSSDNPLTQLLETIVDDVNIDGSKFIKYLIDHPSRVNENGEGYKIFNNREEFQAVAIDCFKNDKFSKDPDYARIAAWKNDTVMNYNHAVRNALIPYFTGEPVKELLDMNDLLIGYKTITDEFNNVTLTNSEDYVINSVVPRVAEGGFNAYAVEIEPRHGGKIVTVNVVDYRDKTFMVFYEIVKKKYFNALFANTDKGAKWRKFYEYKDNFLTLITFPIKQGEDIKTRVQKDIDYAFSLTTHKLQGSTIENTFVDLNDMLYYSTGRVVMNTNWAPRATEIRNKLIYTAISRTSKFCNLYLNLK
jgi:exodeoxyribonuclease-5